MHALHTFPGASSVLLGFAAITAAACVALYIHGCRCDYRAHLNRLRKAADKKKASQA